MNQKKMIILAAAAVIFIIGVIFIVKPALHKKGVKEKVPPAVKIEKGKLQPAPAKKVISKDMGALTVKVLNIKNAPIYLNVKAFLSIDARTSVYVTSFQSNRTRELMPGVYDIEIGTVPAKIYKNINVAKEVETVEDLGCLTGAVNVKALNSKKNAANYNMLILYPKSNIIVASWKTDRPIELLPGIYDISVEMSPKHLEKGVRVDANKETVVDLGCVSGSLLVKAADENNKEARLTTMLKKPGTSEIVAYGMSGRPAEVAPGTYNVDLLSMPSQGKKDVKINAGEETTVEFLINSSTPLRVDTQRSRSIKPLPVPPAKPGKAKK